MQIAVDKFKPDFAKTAMSDQMLERMQASADKKERDRQRREDMMNGGVAAGYNSQEDEVLATGGFRQPSGALRVHPLVAASGDYVNHKISGDSLVSIPVRGSRARDSNENPYINSNSPNRYGFNSPSNDHSDSVYMGGSQDGLNQ